MKFGVWAMFKEVLAYCFGEWRALVQFGGIPFVIVTVTLLLEPNFLSPNVTASQKVIGILLILSQILVGIPLIVSWYRIIVLGKEEAARRPMFTFGPREMRLLGWQIAVTLIGGAAFAVSAAVLAAIYFLGGQGTVAIALCVILGCLALFAILAAINRFSFVFVLATTDQPVTLKGSWAMSRGTTGPMLGTLVLLGLAQALVVSIATPFGEVVAALVRSAATILMFAAMATLFAKVYLRILAGPPIEAPQPSAVTSA